MEKLTQREQRRPIRSQEKTSSLGASAPWQRGPGRILAQNVFTGHLPGDLEPSSPPSTPISSSREIGQGPLCVERSGCYNQGFDGASSPDPSHVCWITVTDERSQMLVKVLSTDLNL